MLTPTIKVVINVTIVIFMVSLSVLSEAIEQQNLQNEHDYSHSHTTINKLVLAESFELNVKDIEASAVLELNLAENVLVFELAENKELYDGEVYDSNGVTAYSGELLGAEGSWARFVSFDGKILGAYYDGKSLFLVHRLSTVRNSIAPVAMSSLPFSISNSQNLNNTFAVFALEDVEHNGTCGNEAHSFMGVQGFEGLVSELKTSLAGTASKQINIALVADTEFVARNTNSSGDSEASAAMLNDLNIASGIFETQFDIRISAAIVTELESNLLDDGVSLETTDPEILVRALRDTVAIPNPGLRHLFTGKDLDGSTVGIAFVGSLCRNSSAGVTQLFNPVTSIILAHELGHNFGARHDSNTTECLAPNGGRYIMFPSVSSSIIPEFSQCSEPNIQDQINSSFSTCIVDIAVNPPVISSTPNTEAEVGVAYAYDADSIVDVDNLGEATFSLDIAPQGMSITVSGLISWTPSAENLGVVPVQIRVENSNGQDTQFYEIQVSSDFINIEDLGVNSYGRNQDKTGGASLNSSFGLTLAGNTWKSIPFSYEITENTVLEFQFSSSTEAEIHGIGFDDDNEISANTFFGIYGSQSWGIQQFRYSGNGETISFKIPVGLFFTGNFDRLVFNTDNDGNIEDANSTFTNIRVYEENPDIGEPNFIDFSEIVISPYRPGNQDVFGTSELIENGFGIELIGNKWQTATLDVASITPTTSLELEFRSVTQGEIHGLSFLVGNKAQRELTFQFYGTQNWGIQDFEYTQVGEYQKFRIPVGTYFTQNTQVTIIFVMDDDVSNPDGNSSFRNVILRDSAVLTTTQQD